MNKLLLAATAAATIVGASAANATVQIRIVDNGTTLNSLVLPSVNGLVYANNGLTVTASAQGVGTAPGYTDPRLDTQSLSIDATGTHNLFIYVTQTGLTYTGTGFTTTNTLNTLGAPNLSTATIDQYVGPNTAFSTTGTDISTLTCGAVSSCANGPMTATASHDATFGETVVYHLNFTGNGSVSATTSLTAAVPETATWAMMLVGFGAVGGALRTSRRKVSFA